MAGGLTLLLVAGAVVVFFTVLRNDDVPTYGPSMSPTLTGDEPVRVDTDAYADSDPQVGDIVVLQGPRGFEQRSCAVVHPSGSACPRAVDDYGGHRLIKRVVAGPEDSIAFARNGGVIRNGEPSPEAYIRECPGTCALPVPVTVPAGHFFVAGDNRAASSDSRIWGAVQGDAIDGRVLLESG